MEDENLNNIDKEKMSQMAEVFLTSSRKEKLPKSLRTTGNIIISILSFSLIFSIGAFYSKSFNYAIMLMVGNIIALICSIGFRLAKRWSLYLFVCIYVVGLCLFFFSLFTEKPLSINRFMISNIVPVVFILTALFNWRYFD